MVMLVQIGYVSLKFIAFKNILVHGNDIKYWEMINFSNNAIQLDKTVS